MVRLHVSAPLHSRYMRGAAEEFARLLDGFTLRPPRIPVLANVDALPYTADSLKERLAAQIASPVRWTETVRRLVGHGDFAFVEVGPGQVLTKLVARIRAAAEPIPPAAPASATAPASPATVPAPPAAVPAPPAAGVPEGRRERAIDAASLGARTFRERYGPRRACLLGSLYGGVSGPEMLRSAAKAGLFGFLGAGGLSVDETERHLRARTDDLGLGGSFGVNVLYRHGAPEQEAALVDLLLRRGVGLVEASGFPMMTEGLVRFRLKGGRILAKVSRTDVAAEFLAPPPTALVQRLLAAGAVTEAGARAAAGRPWRTTSASKRPAAGCTPPRMR